MFDCLASAHGRSATGVWSGVTVGMHVRRVTVCTKHNDVSLLETSSEEVDSARSLDSADTQKHSRTFKGTKCTYQNTPKNHYNPKRKIHFGSGSQISCARRQTIKEPGAFIHTGYNRGGTKTEAFRSEKIGFEDCIFIAVRRKR